MNMRLFFIFSILPVLIFSVRPVAAQEPAIKPGKAYILSGFKDTKDIVTAPVRWKARQWVSFLCIAGAGTALSTQDKTIHDFFQRNRTTASDNIARYGLEPWGSGMYSMASMAALYLQGAITKNQRSKKASLMGVKTFFVTGLAANITKEIFGRHRPFQAEEEAAHSGKPLNPYIFSGPLKNIHYNSFPSGHTTSAFAVATIIAEEYKEKPLIPVIAYTLAGLTGLSRINDNKHWASDVFIAAAFGYSMGKLIGGKNNWGITLLPRTTGIALVVPVG